jgi:hypothetical protein
MSINLATTSAAQAALEVATRFYSPALLNHSIRAYLWGVSYGARHGVVFDDELYFVSAVLHDIGLTAEFDSHTRPFEEARGHLAWVIGTADGWPRERCRRAEEIIVQHMRARVPATEDPESHLLQIAAGWDVAGHHATEFPMELRAEVLGSYPRLGFSPEFLMLSKDQAARKPDSAAAAKIHNDLASRIAANPLDGPA